MADFLLRPQKNLSSISTFSILVFWSNPQVVGTCPGHGPQPIAQNRLFKSFGPEPPPLNTPDFFDSGTIYPETL